MILFRDRSHSARYQARRIADAARKRNEAARTNLKPPLSWVFPLPFSPCPVCYTLRCMPVEALPTSPPPTHPRVEDSREHSFPTSLRWAVDTLFTYHHVATTLQEAPQDEETVQFVELWKQGIMTHLEQTAAAAVSIYLDVFAWFKAGQNVGSREETSGIDPYMIAEVIYGTRIDPLQQSGALRKSSEITDPYMAEDHFNDLRQLYKETCLDMGLAWSLPPRDAKDPPQE